MAEILELSDATFADEVFKAKEPTLVEFWAPWCKPCLFMNPVLQEIASELSGQVKIVKINVDENPMAATLYSVRSIPTMILFRQEQELEKFIGFMGKDELQARIVTAIEGGNDAGDEADGGEQSAASDEEEEAP